VAEILGQLLDGNAPGEHDTGVVVAELVDAFPTGGHVSAATAPVSGWFRDQASFDRAGFQIVSE
jgi:hypothetical protein